MNKDWHERNRMPKNPTTDQRLAWHLEHEANCDCRAMPESLKKLAAKKKP